MDSKEFSPPEMATMLAALQLYRESGYGNPKMERWVSQRIVGIATWSFQMQRLDDVGIERLMTKVRGFGDPGTDAGNPLIEADSE